MPQRKLYSEEQELLWRRHVIALANQWLVSTMQCIHLINITTDFFQWNVPMNCSFNFSVTFPANVLNFSLTIIERIWFNNAPNWLDLAIPVSLMWQCGKQPLDFTAFIKSCCLQLLPPKNEPNIIILIETFLIMHSHMLLLKISFLLCMLQ